MRGLILIGIFLFASFFSLRNQAYSGEKHIDLSPEATLSGKILINVFGSDTIYQYIISLPENSIELLNKSAIRWVGTPSRLVIEKEDEKLREAFSAEREQTEKLRNVAYEKVYSQNLNELKPEIFEPNKQLTYAVLLSTDISQEVKAIINLNTGVKSHLDASELNVGSKRYYRPFKWSPDGKYLAISLLEKFAITAFELYVIDVATSEIVFRYKNSNNMWIEDIAWSPNSKALTVLCKSERTGLWPWELIALIAGHPVPYNSFYLEIIDLKNGGVINRAIKKNITYGRARILWTAQ